MRVFCQACLLAALPGLGLPAHVFAQSMGFTAKVSPKTLAQAAPQTTRPSTATNRPFVLEPENELPGVSFNTRLEREQISGACSSSSASLCYDYRTGRAVYRPARKLMPEISGMRRESLTVKRDKVVLHYSF
jgi:hypothetical protein